MLRIHTGIFPGKGYQRPLIVADRSGTLLKAGLCLATYVRSSWMDTSHASYMSMSDRSSHSAASAPWFSHKSRFETKTLASSYRPPGAKWLWPAPAIIHNRRKQQEDMILFTASKHNRLKYTKAVKRKQLFESVNVLARLHETQLTVTFCPAGKNSAGNAIYVDSTLI
jgi:hypothetical protein